MTAVETLPHVRCSSLPRAMSCTASIDCLPCIDGEPDAVLDSSGELATLGRAAHEFYAMMVDQSLDEPGDIFAIAAKYDVELSDLERLAWAGLREWNKIRDRVKVLAVECELSCESAGHYVLDGHPDLLGLMREDESTLIVLDWKSGYKESNAVPQLKGYGLLALSEMQELDIKKILVVVVWTRLGIVETLEFSVDEIRAFGRELDGVFASKTRRYSPSDANCDYCGLKVGCVARRELMTATGHDLLAILGDEPHPITPSTMAALYPKSRMLKKALEAYEQTLKRMIEESGAPLLSSEGDEIGLKEEPRTYIKYRPDLLKDFISDGECDDLRPNVSKAKLEKIVGENAPPRGKSKAVKACFEAMEKAGAVEKGSITKLVYKRVS